MHQAKCIVFNFENEWGFCQCLNKIQEQQPAVSSQWVINERGYGGAQSLERW